MYDHRVDPHRLEQDHILGKIALRLRVSHRMAAIFDHEGLAGIALQIGQSLDERFGLCEKIGHLGGAGHRNYPAFSVSRLRPIATTAMTSSGTITADSTTCAIIWPIIRWAIGRTP